MGSSEKPNTARCMLNLLLVSSCLSTGAFSRGWPRQSEDPGTDSMMDLEGEGSGFNESTTPIVPAESSPILSASAIANILCSVGAVVFLTVILCYLTRTFSEDERKTRIKNSQENNRRIDEQIAAAKARAERQQKNTQQISLTPGAGDICTASLEIVPTTVQFKPPQDTNSQPLVTETLDDPPSPNVPQVSTGSGVNREVVPAPPALTTNRTVHWEHFFLKQSICTMHVLLLFLPWWQHKVSEAILLASCQSRSEEAERTLESRIECELITALHDWINSCFCKEWGRSKAYLKRTPSEAQSSFILCKLRSPSGHIVWWALYGTWKKQKKRSP